MKKIILYSEIITCDCCGSELVRSSKGWLGLFKKMKYIRFNRHIKIIQQGVYGKMVYYLCPWCKIRIFEKVKKEKQEQTKEQGK